VPSASHEPDYSHELNVGTEYLLVPRHLSPQSLPVITSVAVVVGQLRSLATNSTNFAILYRFTLLFQPYSYLNTLGFEFCFSRGVWVPSLSLKMPGYVIPSIVEHRVSPKGKEIIDKVGFG